MADVVGHALVRVGLWLLTIVCEASLLIRRAVELVEGRVGTADLEVGVLEELDAVWGQRRSLVTSGLLEF
jgi:hypothetical protein